MINHLSRTIGLTLNLLLVAVTVGILGQSGEAQAAVHLTAEGAASFNTDNYGSVSSPSLMAAGELTFGISDLMQYGFVYDHNFLSYVGGGSGSLNFYGGIIRFGFFSGVFVDAQAGIDVRDSSSASFSWGIGGGWSIPLSPLFEAGPRLSYRFVPDSGIERSLLDVGVFLTLKLL